VSTPVGNHCNDGGSTLSLLFPVVGKAVMSSSVPRSEVFLTTKTFNYSKGDTVEGLLPGLIESVKKMHPAKEGEQPYVDLFLIHAPSSGPEGRQTLWDAFQEVR
jgi:diketogulonate reductase-like aldo/keto reductase